MAITSAVAAQSYRQLQPSSAKPTSTGQWQFDGNQWQYQDGNGGATFPPSQFPLPGNGSSPQVPNGTQTYPPNGGQVYPPINGGAAYPNQVNPTYPPSTQQPIYQHGQAYPQAPGQQPVLISPKYGNGNGLSITIGGHQHWVVTFRECPHDPWHYFNCYGSAAEAFAAANALSHKGYWAGVSCRH
jgi:hypothetical protein